jgi:zinc transporter ZupT
MGLAWLVVGIIAGLIAFAYAELARRFLACRYAKHTWLIFAEGLAAGAMLTMIPAAMIPEAVHMGKANAVGLSTLAGCLAAISFKLLE